MVEHSADASQGRLSVPLQEGEMSEYPIIPRLLALRDELNRLAMNPEMMETCDLAIAIIKDLHAEKDQRQEDLRTIGSLGRFW